MGLLEVERYREIDLRFHLMSLWMLHDGRELPATHGLLLDRSPKPGQVVAAATQRCGEPILRDLHLAMATPIIHLDGMAFFRPVLPRYPAAGTR